MTNEDGDIIPPNETLGAILRKLQDGAVYAEMGAEVQEYIKGLRIAAKKRGKRIMGKVVIELPITMGQDGYVLATAKLTTKPIPRSPVPESVIYTDEDGDINGAPVPKQTTIFEVKNGGGKGKDVAAPAAKGM